MKKFVPYYEYIESQAWVDKKLHWIRLFGNKCVCSKPGQHLHHRHYKNLGTEPPHQLILLCKACHMFVHGLPEKHTTDKRQLKLNLRKLLRRYGPKASPTGTLSGAVFKTIN